MRSPLADQIKCLRESAREILQDEGDTADKITEIGNSIMEIANTFDLLREAFSDIGKIGS